MSKKSLSAKESEATLSLQEVKKEPLLPEAVNPPTGMFFCSSLIPSNRCIQHLALFLYKVCVVNGIEVM